MDVEFLKYKYEDGYDGIVVKNKIRPGVRHIQILYMLACSTVIGVVRGSSGIGVLAVTDQMRINDTYIQIKSWDTKIQGTVLSSFFFGYALMIVPAELFLKKVGGKYVLTTVLIVNGAILVAMPTLVNKGGWIAVCNAQLWLGMTQACLSPANQSLLGRWLPPDERGFSSCLVHAGVLLGIISALPIMGVLSEARLGWELIYYAEAMLTISMAITWTLLTSSAPENHQAVGDKEKEYIQEALSTSNKRSLMVPWISILRCQSFWATALAHSACHALFIFFLIEVPAYFVVFGYTLKESAWRSAIPFSVLFLVHMTTAPTLEWIANILFSIFHLSTTHFRKLINAAGALGVVAGLLILPTLPETWEAKALIILALIFWGLSVQYSGFLESFKDMSQNYCGSLLMMSSAIAALFGALVPVFTGVILRDDSCDPQRWRILFLEFSGFYAIFHLIYTVLGSSERQPWDGGVKVTDKFGYHNVMLDSNPIEMDDLKP